LKEISYHLKLQTWELLLEITNMNPWSE